MDKIRLEPRKSIFQPMARKPGKGTLFSSDAPIGTNVPSTLQRTCFQGPDTMLDSQKFFIRQQAMPAGHESIALPAIEHEVVTCHVLKYDKILPLSMVNGYILYLYNYLISRDNIILGSKRFFTIFLGIMLNLLDFSAGPRIITLVGKSGYTVVFQDITEDELNLLIAENVSIENLEKYQLVDPENEEGFRLIMMCSMLTLIGKRITPENNENFFKARFRAFGNKMGSSEIAKTLINQVFYPNAENCADAYSLIASYHPIRKELFQTILSASRVESRAKGRLEVLLRYLAGTEMTHIILIDQWLMSRYPELMSLRILRGYEAVLIAAYTFLLNLEPENRLYAKLLYDEHETQCIHANLFQVPLMVSRIIASHEISSFLYYTIQPGKNEEALQKIIKSYLDSGLEVSGQTTILFSGHNQMNEVARHQMIEEVYGGQAALQDRAPDMRN